VIKNILKNSAPLLGAALLILGTAACSKDKKGNGGSVAPANMVGLWLNTEDIKNFSAGDRSTSECDGFTFTNDEDGYATIELDMVEIKATGEVMSLDPIKKDTKVSYTHEASINAAGKVTPSALRANEIKNGLPGGTMTVDVAINGDDQLVATSKIFMAGSLLFEEADSSARITAEQLAEITTAAQKCMNSL
jgi:hypothetical protein